MKRVLITGATGFLGGYAVAEFVNSGYDVIAQGRNEQCLLALSRHYSNVIPYVTSLADLNSNATNTAKFKNINCVVHIAALSTVWGKWADFYASNVEGTAEVVKFCKNNNIPKLVFVSSPSIYSAKSDRLNIQESDFDPNNRLNHYIKSKILAEKVVNASCLETVIIRPRGLIGKGDTSIIPRLLQANRKMGIPLFNQGENIVDLTSVENVALSLLLATQSKRAVGNTYNITNGEPTKFKTILGELFSKLGITPKYRNMNINVAYNFARIIEAIYKFFHIYKEPFITKYTITTLGYSQTLDISAAKKDLNYIPKKTLCQSIDDYVVSGAAK